MYKTILALVIITFFSSTANAQTAPLHAEDISPLLIGETLPNAQLFDSDGKMIEVNSLLTNKPTVFVFYRGGWCPYCNAQLSGLVDIEQQIVDLGYQIVAISPDDYRNLKNTEEKDKIKYQVLSDKDGAFIKQIGIAFQTPSAIKGYVESKGQKGETASVLPVPTVLVINKKGEILFEYINPNYKQRINGDMLLAVLKTIK
jgi:peroxiredoxin